MRERVMELTSQMMHKYYCENDVEHVISMMDDDILWLGAGEREWAVGKASVAGVFRTFAGQVPKCKISEEQYHVLQLASQAWLCSGRMWIATDESTQISLRVHQRITTVFRWIEGRLCCCHIHISNPYEEMAEEDLGFPSKMAQQSYQYLQEQIAAQRKKISAQTERLRRMSYEDSLTGLFNRNKYNQILKDDDGKNASRLGVACFDLNGLKQVNDRLGHSAGDDLIQRTAAQLRNFFEGRAYRIGGDEFVVIDDVLEEQAFEAAVQAAQREMEQIGISCSVGSSWRNAHCSVKEQCEEADRLMYQQKRCYYQMWEHDRREKDKNQQTMASALNV